MKKMKSLIGLFASCFAIVLALAVWAGINPPVSVSASSYDSWSGGAYDYEIEEYETEINISSKRVVSVKERITANFTGYDSHGIIRDFPLGGGVVYRNISAKCENSGDFSPYFQTDDINFLSYYLKGDGRVTGQSRVYLITYEMIVPALKEEGYLPLNVLGYGWQTTISSFSATISLPGELNTEPIIYSGDYGADGNYADAKIEKSAEHEYRVTALDLYNYSYNNTAAGITVDFSFQAGVLKANADLPILYAFLVGAVLLGIACLIRFIGYRRPILVKPINFTAPKKMDPFLMGKLIDDNIDKEDYGAVFFYLASKGYLHIDLTEDQKNPTVYKSQKPFGGEPQYCKEMYDALFDERESVKISELSNSFYITADRMKSLVVQKAGKIYRGMKFPLVVLGILALLLLGGFAWLYSMLTVSAGYMLGWVNFVSSAFGFILPAAGVNVFTRRRYKWKKVWLVFTVLGFFILGAGLGSLFCLIPSPAFGWGTGFVLALFAAGAGILAGDCVTPSNDYAEKLSEILGFKQFIQYTERDRIEFMLKENPELYYEVLPYAQVLGVTDAWTEKFKGLKISPPSYCSYQSSTVFDCLVWISVYRAFNHSVSSNMVTRPSPKGGHGGGVGKGGFGGGIGGGFGGGGFGGGGGRGC